MSHDIPGSINPNYLYQVEMCVWRRGEFSGKRHQIEATDKKKKIQYVNPGPVQLKDLELNDMETICKASWLPVYTSKFLIIS